MCLSDIFITTISVKIANSEINLKADRYFIVFYSVIYTFVNTKCLFMFGMFSVYTKETHISECRFRKKISQFGSCLEVFFGNLRIARYSFTVIIYLTDDTISFGALHLPE